MFISREMYLKKIRNEKRTVTFFRFLIIAIFIGCWEVLARINVINTFTFSSPSNVIKAIIGLKSSLFLHIGVTLYETLLSFVLSIFIGLREQTGSQAFGGIRVFFALKNSGSLIFHNSTSLLAGVSLRENTAS